MAKRGGFFAVDKATWARVCPGLGLNASVAYLVLAAFSGADNETTAASVNAVEKYTGIARARAAAAIKVLIDAGVVLQEQGGSRPRYKLIPYTAPAPPAPKPARGRKPAAPPPAPSSAPALAMIWLPNALVTGAKGEASPVERVRQTGDPFILRLLVDLYYGQNLRDDGGIARSIITMKFTREKVAEHGAFVVWGFRHPGTAGHWVTWGELTDPHKREKFTPEEQAAGVNKAVDFFPRLQTLVDLGLVQWVPHLVESEASDAEVIHPYGMGPTDDMEDRLGGAAHAAGRALLQHNQQVDNRLWLAPLPKHYTRAAMVGVARLRYRPHTSNTAVWYGQLQTLGAGYLDRYARLAAGETNVFATG